MTLDAVRKEFGVKRVTAALRERAEDILRGEIVSYDAYLGGRVYGYVIEHDGEEVDVCWGFVGDYELDCLSTAQNAAATLRKTADDGICGERTLRATSLNAAVPTN